MRTRRETTDRIYSVEKLKQHLRVYSEDENEYIEDLAESAVAYIESYIGANVRRYTTTLSGKAVKDKKYKLKRLDEIISVKINGEITDNYEFCDGAVCFSEDYDNVEIIFAETVSSIQYIQQCINLLVADWYENREGDNGKSHSPAISSLTRLLALQSNPVN